MGAVYKARHIHLDKLIVLKILNKESATDKMLVRFHNEAKILCQLVHSNISQYFDFGVSEDNQPFLAIEFIEGKTLREVLQHDVEMPFEEIIQIGIQICEALDYAHGKGIIHRDVKPSNIVIADTEEGHHAVLLDFGIAQLLDSRNAEGQFLTPTGELVGSPRYMSPEQASGKFADNKTDQYSLACVLYEMVTRNVPLVGETVMETLALKKNDVAPLLSQVTERFVPEELEQIVSTMLSKEPEDRYSAMAEVRADLVSVLENLVSGKQEANNEQVESEPELIQVTSTRFYKGKFFYLFLAVAIFPIAFGYSMLQHTEIKEDPKIKLEDYTEHIKFEVNNPIDINKNRIELVINSQEDIRRLKELNRYTILQNLEISFADSMPPECLDYIAQAKDLISLKIDASGFKLTNLKSLGKLNYLKILNIRGSVFSDNEIEAIISLRSLTHLNIAGTRVTANGLIKLKNLSSLHYLELDRGLVETKQFKMLADMMPNCSFIPFVLVENSKGSIYPFSRRQFVKKAEIKSKIRLLREKEEIKLAPITDTVLRNKIANEINKKCYRLAVDSQGQNSYAAGFYLLESMKNQAYSMKFDKLVNLVKDIETKYSDYKNIVFRAKTYRGDLLWNLGKYQESLTLAQESLVLAKKIFFPNDGQIPDCYERIFYRLYHTDHHEEAAEVAKSAVEFVKKWFKPEDSQVGNINVKALRVSLALAPGNQKMTQAAILQGQRCINWFEYRRKEKVRVEEAEISTYVEALFSLFILDDDKKAKKSYLIRATKWLNPNMVLAQKIPILSTDCYVNLARIFIAENNQAKAEKLLRKAILIIDSVPTNQQAGRAVDFRKELLGVLEKQNRMQESKNVQDQIAKLEKGNKK